MKVGTAQIEITPPVGQTTELSGFVAREQPALGVHDPLFARALHLGDGKRRLLWLHVDLIAFETADAAALKTRMQERFGLSADEVFLSATHTHSGPPTVRLINCGEYDPRYLAWLERHLLHAAANALSVAQDAELVVGEGHCELAIDRRGKPTKHTDPRIGVLAWRTPAVGGGRYLAVLANYAIHNVAMGHENRLVSADIAGRAAARIAAELPGEPLVLFTNGGAGNLNPPAVTNDFAQMEQWGDQLASAVLAGLASAAAVPAAAAEVRSRATVAAVPDVALSEQEIESIARQRTGFIEAKSAYVADRLRDAVARWRVQMLDRVHDLREPPTTPLPIQAVQMGPVTLVGFGAEIFSIAADELRARTGRKLYVVGYANGDMGYLAPRMAHEEGGYETAGAFVYYGRLPSAPGGFESALDTAAKLVCALT